MPLTSPAYLAFLLVVYLLFWLTGARGRLPLIAIVSANYLFYGLWGWIYAAAVPLCSLADYAIARAIHASSRTPRRRALLLASLALNLGLIVSTRLPDSAVPVALPLSLSFYGFQALTYTLDVYRRDAGPVPALLPYLASVSFFPTTLAGPITRVAVLAAQWPKLAVPLPDPDGGRALFLIGLGAAKKFLIADYLAVNLVNRVFDTPLLYSGMENLIAVYGYAFQLYYDFSGYTDIALGSALLLGLKLPANFNRPYEALNIADFWRRWHISFSNWLRDYLFYALPGSRSRVWPYINLVITMTIGGLWHGFSWGFAVWGILHGMALSVTRWWQAWRQKPGRRPAPPWPTKLACRLLAFHFVCLCWIFFRAESLEGAWLVINQIASATVAFDNVAPAFAAVLASAAILHFLPVPWYAALRDRFASAPAILQAAALALLVLGIRYVASSGAAPFVYQRF